ncbi:hypothetical protein CK203_036387 [Vitis vinifera]|uniref:Uncharacterized protein n=1 Tax=Vitis vinifera TaxID=29760 RepID=A0A438HYV4_VITVI|nr:hypothetical protein CK203_036387 [Vitis vinifera]
MLQKKPNQKETDAMIVQEAKQMCSSNPYCLLKALEHLRTFYIPAETLQHNTSLLLLFSSLPYLNSLLWNSKCKPSYTVILCFFSQFGGQILTLVQHGVSRRDFNILDFGAIFLSNRTPQEDCLLSFKIVLKIKLSQVEKSTQRHLCDLLSEKRLHPSTWEFLVFLGSCSCFNPSTTFLRYPYASQTPLCWNHLSCPLLLSGNRLITDRLKSQKQWGATQGKSFPKEREGVCTDCSEGWESKR